ncbi:putative RNA helicase [Helianthus anomalus]
MIIVFIGRGYNVQIFHVEEPVSDYLRATVSTVMSIHEKEPMGVILVFLTRQDDIDTFVQLITGEAQNSGKSSLGLIILPLYSGLTRADHITYTFIFFPFSCGYFCTYHIMHL